MKINILAALLLIAVGCSTTKPVVQNQSTTPQNIAVTGKVFATLFQQQAAEYRALCFQAFNIAQLRVEQSLQSTSTKPRAIITDIDETILDNSKYDVHQTLQGKDYEATSWQQWTEMAAADTVPGAPAFLKYAASKGITIFYITNRDERERKGTLLNLQKFNLPNVDNEHLILKQTISSKESRRQQVTKTHDVILLIGDNLADLSYLYDKKSVEERLNNTDILSAEFGKKFIVIPNPVYGDWETALYKYNYTLTPAQKDSVIKKMLKGY